MARHITATIMTCTALLVAFVGPSASAQSYPPCPSITGTAYPGSYAHGSERCAQNSTPHVAVNGRELLTIDRSNHGNTVLFYGQGSVVRLDQRSARIYVVAVTTDRVASVRIWFTPFRRSTH